MAFRAFVVGANYVDLKYAEKDAQRIADRLHELAYVLPEPRVPPLGEDKKAIRERFEKVAFDCNPEDTLLFYFAGHGLIHEGILCLVLDGYDPSANPLQTCLNFNDISTIFQGVRAAAKLVVLDCCHAGKSFSRVDFNFSDNYTVLTASESFKKALELKDHKAGFLSHHLHNALTDDLEQVSRNRHVLLGKVHRYLREKVQEHNRTAEPSDRVPEITDLSKQTKEIVLAEIPEDMSLKPIYGLQRINHAFLAAQKDKTGPEFIPANFYGAIPNVQWWGVTNDLVSEQSLYPAVEEHVRQAVNGYFPLIGIIYGSGGMGKSILLRRLGVALAEEFDVWWLEDTEELLKDRKAAEEKLLESGRPQIVLLDDWTALEEDARKELRTWFNQLNKSGDSKQLKFVLTGRSWSNRDLSKKLISSGGLFEMDKQSNLGQDNPLLLDKAAEVLNDPEWHAAAQELRSTNLAQTKPFHLLFVFMRLAPESLREKIAKGQDVAYIFSEIIESDLERLWQDEHRKGLAAAVSTMAWLHVQFIAGAV
ncbi:MAG: caspase family protein [Candidatus Electrothrix sp. YB6]